MSKKRGLTISKLIMLCIFVGMVLLPLLTMLFNVKSENIRRVFAQPMTLEIIGNSIKVSIVATTLSVLIGYILAWSTERVQVRFSKITKVILTLPMLIPSISHGMGLIILFGNNGIITNFLHLNSGIYGFWGIVVGSILYAYPVAYLMLVDALRYEDCRTFEAAEILNIPKWRQIISIHLPYMKKALINTFFAAFTMIVTDYGVPLMIGGKYKTLSVAMYQEVIGQLNFGNGCVYGSLLLVPAVMAFIIDLYSRNNANEAFVIQQFKGSTKKNRKILAYTVQGLMVFATLFPIASFIILGFANNYPNDLTFSLGNIQKVINLHGDTYLMNSIMIALLAATIGSIIGFLTAYFSARTHTLLSKALHLFAITSMAIPGIVLGLSYVLVYNKTPIYGTLMILAMVNIVHFIASPYLMMYNSFSKVNENMEAVGETMGINTFHMIKDIFLPHALPTLFEMFCYFFVNSMMTISAVSFLATTYTKPISLMINQFEAQMQLENAAIVSLAILIVNILMKAISAFIRDRAYKFA